MHMTYRRWKFPLPGLWKGIDLGKDPRCWPRKRLESDHWPCWNDWFCLWLLKALGCVFWLVPTRDQHDDDGCCRPQFKQTCWYLQFGPKLQTDLLKSRQGCFCLCCWANSGPRKHIHLSQRSWFIADQDDGMTAWRVRNCWWSCFQNVPHWFVAHSRIVYK